MVNGFLLPIWILAVASIMACVVCGIMAFFESLWRVARSW